MYQYCVNEFEIRIRILFLVLILRKTGMGTLDLHFHSFHNIPMISEGFSIIFPDSFYCVKVCCQTEYMEADTNL